MKTASTIKKVSYVEVSLVEHPNSCIMNCFFTKYPLVHTLISIKVKLFWSYSGLGDT